MIRKSHFGALSWNLAGRAFRADGPRIEPLVDFGEWPSVFGTAKTTTVLQDR